MSTGAHRGRRVLLTLAGLLFALVPAGGVGASPVAAGGGPHAKPQPSAPTLSDMLAKDPAATWYAIGDSYISGEGTFSYYGASNNKKTDDYCHRSPQSYAALIGIPENHFFACSGAPIRGIGWEGWQHRPAQVPRIPASARVVLVSAGGDSLNFAGVIKDCLQILGVQHIVADKGCQTEVDIQMKQVVNDNKQGQNQDKYTGCASSPSTKATASIPARSLYVPDTTVPIDEYVCMLLEIKHFAPQARIMVVGYPRLFPAHPSNSCSTIPAAYQDLLNNADSIMDTDLIRAAVNQAQTLGVKASYVSTWNAWSGHEMCQPSPDINKITTGVPVVVGGLVGFATHSGCHIVAGTVKTTCVESAHPTAAGYSALEPAVWSATDSALPQVCVTSPCSGIGQNGEELKVTGITSDTSTVDGVTYRVLAVTVWVDDPPSGGGGSDILFGGGLVGTGVSVVDSQHTSVNWWDNSFPFAGPSVQEADGRTCFSGTGGGYTVLPGETLTVPLDYCFDLAGSGISYPILQLTVDGQIFTPALLTT